MERRYREEGRKTREVTPSLGLQGAVVACLFPLAAREQEWSKGSAARKKLEWAPSLLPVPVWLLL